MAEQRKTIRHRLTYEQVNIDADGNEVIVRNVSEVFPASASDDATALVGILFALVLNAVCNADEPWPQGVVAAMLRRVRDLDEPFRELAQWEDDWDGETSFAEHVAMKRQQKESDHG